MNQCDTRSRSPCGCDHVQGPTSVVVRVCEACGFDGAAYDDAALITALRALGPRWRQLLAGSGSELRVRPEPEVWSALEYAAHSRDITALHCFGVEQALTGTEPVLPEIAADELIEGAAATYADDDPAEVADALETAAARLADLARGLGVRDHDRHRARHGSRLARARLARLAASRPRRDARPAVAACRVGKASSSPAQRSGTSLDIRDRAASSTRARSCVTRNSNRRSRSGPVSPQSLAINAPA